MTGSLPLFIPPELCATVALEPQTPVEQCLELVTAEVGDGGVSAPPGADVDGLSAVVADAAAEGFDLKIVVLDANPPIDTPLRDIATEVGLAHPGSTVLALSPSYAGTYSPDYDRVTLEAGQDVAKTGDPVVSAQNFLTEVQSPDFPWTALSVLVAVGVIVAVIVTRRLHTGGKHL